MTDLNRDNFDKEVLNETGLVVVDFWGEGCEPCKVLMPEFEQLAEKYSETVKFAKLNTTNERKLSISQRVLGIPTIVFYKNGKRIGELSNGTANTKTIETFLNENI